MFSLWNSQTLNCEFSIRGLRKGNQQVKSQVYHTNLSLSGWKQCVKSKVAPQMWASEFENNESIRFLVPIWVWVGGLQRFGNIPQLYLFLFGLLSNLTYRSSGSKLSSCCFSTNTPQPKPNSLSLFESLLGNLGSGSLVHSLISTTSFLNQK